MADSTKAKADETKQTEGVGHDCVPAEPETDDLSEEAPNPEAVEEQPEADPMAQKLDQALRALAEAENGRKRAERDRETTAKYAISKFAGDMLAVADNLHRALATIAGSEERTEDSVQSLIEGVELTGRELENALARHGIEKIDPMGQAFDHNFHEVLFEVEVADQPPGTVIQVMELGYRIHDRLLRPARVGLAKKPPKSEGVDTEA